MKHILKDWYETVRYVAKRQQVDFRFNVWPFALSLVIHLVAIIYGLFVGFSAVSAGINLVSFIVFGFSFVKANYFMKDDDNG